MLDEHQPENDRRAMETKPREIEPNAPDKVTVAWLFKHVPVTLWLWAAGLLSATFFGHPS